MTIPTSNLTVDHYAIHRNRVPFTFTGESYTLNEEIFATFGVRDTASTAGKCGKYAINLKCHPNNGIVDLCNTYTVSTFGDRSLAVQGGAWDNYMLRAGNYDTGVIFTMKSPAPPDLLPNLWTFEFFTYGNDHMAMNNTSTWWPIVGNATSGFSLRMRKTVNANPLRVTFQLWNNDDFAGVATMGDATLNAGMNSWVVQCDASFIYVWVNGTLRAYGPAISLDRNQFRFGNAGYGPAIHLVEFRLAVKALYASNAPTIYPSMTDRWLTA